MKTDEYYQKLKASGSLFILAVEDDSTDEYVHFYFLADHEGKEALFNTVMYTLRLQHESELFEIAEHKAAQHFPAYRKIKYEEDENGNLETLDDLEEEIGLFMAEVMMELEEEEAIKVKEHVDMDVDAGDGIGLDVGLNVEKISDEIISSFVRAFREDRLELDETLYSFQTSEAE